MNRILRSLLLASVLVLDTAAGAAQTASGVVAEFYGAYIEARPAGLPEGVALARLRPLLSKRLHALIVAANAYQEDFGRRHPDEKPPFVDGDHFTSVFEGPQTFEITRVVRKGKSHDVHVRFGGGEGAAPWTDVVVVKKESGRFVIDDVRFSGAGKFNPAGSLVRTLQSREE